MAIVYRHRDNLNNVFYIGIGKNENRAFDYHHRSDFWKRYSKKYGINTEIIATNIDYDTAKELEMLLISEYGRRDLKEGMLVNMTDGGEGSIGVLHTKERREKASKMHSGKGNPRARAIYSDNLNMYFDTISECADFLKLSQPYVSRMLIGSRTNKYNLKYV